MNSDSDSHDVLSHQCLAVGKLTGTHETAEREVVKEKSDIGDEEVVIISLDGGSRKGDCYAFEPWECYFTMSSVDDMHEVAGEDL